MNDPLSKIRTGSQLERNEIGNVDDPLSQRDEQDAKINKKPRTASQRAQNFEEQLVKELRQQVRFLQDRICLNENLPSKVAQLESVWMPFARLAGLKFSSHWGEPLRLGFPVS